MKKTKRPIDVYVTRGSYMDHVRIYPAKVGIRKFHGCVAWGAAWCENYATPDLTRRGTRSAKRITPDECRTRFGFYPRPGTAWLVEYNAKGKMEKSKVDIDFSN